LLHCRGGQSAAREPHAALLTFACNAAPYMIFLKNYVFVCHFLFLLQSLKMLQSSTVAASVRYSITFASCSKKNHDVIKAQIAN